MSDPQDPIQPPSPPSPEFPHDNPFQTPAQPPLNPSTPMQKGLGDNAGVRMLLPVGRSGWAIAAGYLGLFSVTCVLAPLSLIISIVAIWDIKRSKGTGKQKHGMGRAIFGLVMGILGTLLLGFMYFNVTRY
ncbi:hypothetical protein NT6N_36530 [Oceaniferula spumae]|uniref:DUF4190 domain-containing protein n=1 Tax=Oceaniferula spumae TaxID=2979115 RepID=A0AAT9FRK0_9BACT